MHLQLHHEIKVLRILINFPFLRSVDSTKSMAVSPVTLTNSKRKADEMESSQPEELRAVKVQKTESVERKYQKIMLFLVRGFNFHGHVF